MKILALIIASLLIFPAFSLKEEEMIFSFCFSEPEFEEEGGEYRIIIEECSLHEYKGLIIPVKSLFILLPYKKDVKSIEVNAIEKYAGEYRIGKAKSLIVANKKIIPSSNEFIEEKYEIVGNFYSRGYKIFVVNLIPIAYRNGELYYREKMDVKIKLKEGEENKLYRGIEEDKEFVKKIVINPWIADTYPEKELSNQYEYLIITKNDFIEAFGEFAKYKESKGIKIKIASIEEIEKNSSFLGEKEIFNDTQAKIRNFIRYAYSEWGIKYVLLGGDADINNSKENILPARYLYASCVGLPLGEEIEADIPSDVYYACLDGNFNEDEDERWGENSTGNEHGIEEADLFSEVWVGRVCADSKHEIENFIRKSKSYEENAESMEVLLVGEFLGFGGIADWGGNYMDEIKPLIPSYFNITTLYERDRYWHKEELISSLERGCNFVNHLGHGWTTHALKMSNSDLDNLQNKEYFFLYSQTCLAGSFDNAYPYGDDYAYYSDDCFAEHLTLSENGAFACIMNSRYGLGMENSTDSPGQRYNLAFYEGIFKKNIYEIGGANHYSKEANVWRINENGMRWIYYETNLLGDPQIKIKEPEEKINLSIEILKPLKGLYILDFG
ncbi:MAG: C25 family cysteine peptidase, partial [Candidatus Thermoplasmatota archaeon]